MPHTPDHHQVFQAKSQFYGCRTCLQTSILLIFEATYFQKKLFLPAFLYLDLRFSRVFPDLTRMNHILLHLQSFLDHPACLMDQHSAAVLVKRDPSLYHHLQRQVCFGQVKIPPFPLGDVSLLQLSVPFLQNSTCQF